MMDSSFLSSVAQDSLDGGDGDEEQSGDLVVGVEDRKHLLPADVRELCRMHSRQLNNVSMGLHLDDPLCRQTDYVTTKAEAHSAVPHENIDYFKIGVISLIIILTLVGNVAVVLSILMRRAKVRNVTRMYFFILHLSIADVLTAFFTLLPELIWTFTHPSFYGGNILCKVVKYLFVVGPYLSSYTLVMTAVDRYQAICFPLSNYRWTIHKSNVMLGVSWLVSLLFSIPQTIVYGVKNNDNTCRPYWEPKWGAKAYTVWFSFSNFFVPFVVLLFCYGNMCVALWTNFKKKKEQQPAAATTSTPQLQPPPPPLPSSATPNNENSFCSPAPHQAVAAASALSSTPSSSNASSSFFNRKLRFLSLRSRKNSHDEQQQQTTPRLQQQQQQQHQTLVLFAPGMTQNKARKTLSTSAMRRQSMDSTLTAPRSSSLGGRIRQRFTDWKLRRRATPEADDAIALPDPQTLLLGKHELQEGNNINSPQLKETIVRTSPTSSTGGGGGGDPQDDPSGTTSPSAAGNGDVQCRGKRLRVYNQRRFSSLRVTASTGSNGAEDDNDEHSDDIEESQNLLQRTSSSSLKGMKGTQTPSTTTTPLKAFSPPMSGGGGSNWRRHFRQAISQDSTTRSSTRRTPLTPMTPSSFISAAPPSTPAATTTSSSNYNCPRAHSIRTISNAKIKTVKLTVVVVVGYLFCSAPTVFIQLYSAFAQPDKSFNEAMKWIFWLFTLNSCLNPWIYMAFNPELVNTLFGGRFKRNAGNGGMTGIGQRSGNPNLLQAGASSRIAATTLQESQVKKHGGGGRGGKPESAASSLLLRRVQNRAAAAAAAAAAAGNGSLGSTSGRVQLDASPVTTVITHCAPSSALGDDHLQESPQQPQYGEKSEENEEKRIQVDQGKKEKVNKEAEEA